MADIHPAATHHLPAFIPGPDNSDPLMTVMAIILLASVMGFGILFLRLHTLPERIAHRSHKLQFEIVAVLGLIALFTHMHIFWIAGLLLAMIDLPDFGTSLNRIAGSAEKIAGIQPGEGDGFATPEAMAANKPAAETSQSPPATESPNKIGTAGTSGDSAPANPDIAPTKPKELIHA